MKKVSRSSLEPKGFALRAKWQRTSATWMDSWGWRSFRQRDFVIEREFIPIPGLDPVFHNYRIAHLTDLHLGQWLSVERLQGVVALVNNLEPDAIALTGDFVSYLLDDVADDLVEALSRLSAPDGTTAVLGNHDHWTDAEQVRKLLRDSGATVLDNDWTTVERAGEELHIAGVDDVMVGMDRLDKLMNSMPARSPAILLAHEPDFADISAATGRFALQLSGHSHGTQVVLPGGKPVIRGPHFRNYPIGRYEVQEMTLYTNRGLGTNVFWMRMNCPPEIALLTLQTEDRRAGHRMLPRFR